MREDLCSSQHEIPQTKSNRPLDHSVVCNLETLPLDFFSRSHVPFLSVMYCTVGARNCFSMWAQGRCWSFSFQSFWSSPITDSSDPSLCWYHCLDLGSPRGMSVIVFCLSWFSQEHHCSCDEGTGVLEYNFWPSVPKDAFYALHLRQG